MSQGAPSIFLIAGSAEKPSRVRTSLDVLVDLFHDMGAYPYLWDLSEQPLPPLYLAQGTETYLTEPAVQQFMQHVKQSDAFVFGSPVYHNSFSGILKNALDMLPAQHFYHKPVALVSNGHSERTASLPCEHLRSVVKGLSAVAVPTQIVTIPSDFLLTNDHYVFANTTLSERFVQVAKELVHFTIALQNVSHLQMNIPSPVPALQSMYVD